MTINDLLDSEWVLPLLLVFCFAFFFVVVFNISKSQKKVFSVGNEQAEVIENPATIIYKSTENNGFIEFTRIVFEFEDGKRIDLAVKDASTLLQGDKGILKYQGNKFISFDRYTEN